MSETPAPAARAAFNELLDLLRERGERYLSAENAGTDPLDAAEGFRFLAQLLETGLDLYLEADPERPVFKRMVSPTRKYLGDNPDAIYHWAPIHGDRAYRISGVRGDEAYFSVTVHGKDPKGGVTERVISDRNYRQITYAPDGSFELFLSAEPQPGNWVKLEPDASSVITRHYFQNRTSAAAEVNRVVRLRIDPLADPGAPPPLTDARIAGGLRAVAAFVRGATQAKPSMARTPRPVYAAEVPNEVGTPTSFREAGAGSWGGADIAYSMGWYRLAPDEALVMEGRFPACAFANVVLWNRFRQTFDYRHRRVSLNLAQTALEPDGSYRIVIAHRDPGLPNWLDTEGHREGMIFWRFLLAAEKPEKPRCRVVQLSEAPKLG
jgi:hypothetical protein